MFESITWSELATRTMSAVAATFASSPVAVIPTKFQ
jgi:hypothetical protein